MSEVDLSAEEKHRAIEIATAVRAVLEGCGYHEAFVGIVSAFAGVIVEGAPDERQARIAASQFGTYLSGTVEVLLTRQRKAP